MSGLIRFFSNSVYAGRRTYDPPSSRQPFSPLDLDFTTDTVPDGATVARTAASGIMWLARSGSDFVSTAGAVFEDLGFGRKGWWSFHSYSNGISRPFGIGESGWSAYNSPSISDVTGPDGTVSAKRISDNSTSDQVNVSITPGTTASSIPRVVSVYYKNGNPPPSDITSSNGALYYANAGQPSLTRPLGYTSNWTRANTHYTNQVLLALIPLGFDKWSYAETYAATGSRDFWGAQYIEGSKHNLPLVSGSTGAQTISLNSNVMHKIVDDNGDLDIEVDVVTHLAGKTIDLHPDDAIIFKMTGSDGEHSLRFIAASGSLQLKMRSVDVSGANFGHVGCWKEGGLVRFRVTYRPSTLEGRIRAEFNGCIGNSSTYPTEAFFSASAGALQDPDAVYICHDGNATNLLPCQVRRVRTFAGSQPVRKSCNIMTIGDSISAFYSSPLISEGFNQYPIGSEILTIEEAASGTLGVVDLSVPGASIADAIVTYNNCNYKTTGSVELIYLHIGTNDLLGLGHSGATVNADLQTLVNTVRADHATAKIVLCAPTPHGADTQWWTVYTSVYSGSFTGVDRFNVSGAISVITDFATNHALKSFAARDSVHPYNSGRDRIGATWRSDAIALGKIT